MTEKENIKVIVKTFENINDDIVKEKLTNDVKSEFENIFKDLKCSKCNENSKGTVIVGLNTENRGVLLEYQDFCCFEFMEYVRNVPN